MLLVESYKFLIKKKLSKTTFIYKKGFQERKDYFVLIHTYIII